MPYIMLIPDQMNRRIYFTIPDELMAFGAYFAMINTSGLVCKWKLETGMG